ncbi:MAG: 2-dehydropantoate 2-reductase [Bacteroidales bacterium]|nr:2-dehydropantoate 2-reductase [Bacteroidales bacterium]NLK81855.1 2-dehydropantoate 2-reductase [Bacteroidales bacterium]
MRIAIIGIGGIGGYIGSKLCENHLTKHEICFIQRGLHGKMIQKHGLVYKGKTTNTYKPHSVYETFENAGIFDIIFVCIKSKDLEQTIRSLQHNIHAQSCIITLLNGVSNAKRIQQLLPQHRVLQGCIYVSAAIEKPGVVQQVGGAGNVVFGPENGIIQTIDKKTLTLLLNANIQAKLSTTIQKDVWEKYLFICTFASITSRYNLPIGTVVRNKEYYQITQKLLNEVCIVAQAHNIFFTEDDKQAVLNLACKIPEHTPTSMQIDIYKGRTSEIDIFTEYIIQEAQKHNVQLPMHKKIYAELQEIITHEKKKNEK